MSRACSYSVWQWRRIVVYVLLHDYVNVRVCNLHNPHHTLKTVKETKPPIVNQQCVFHDCWFTRVASSNLRSAASSTCLTPLTWMTLHFLGFYCRPMSCIAVLVARKTVLSFASDAANTLRSSTYNRCVTLVSRGLDRRYP